MNVTAYTLLMISQHFFQVMAWCWANVHPDICHQMASLGHNEKILIVSFPLLAQEGMAIHFNSLAAERYGSYFAYVILKYILVINIFGTSHEIALRWMPKGPSYGIWLLSDIRASTDSVVGASPQSALQWNLSVTTTSIIKSIACDLFSNMF